MPLKRSLNRKVRGLFHGWRWTPSLAQLAPTETCRNALQGNSCMLNFDPEGSMMADAFYRVEFGALLPRIAPGIVVLENGQVRGGDSNYIYSGTYSGGEAPLRCY